MKLTRESLILWLGVVGATLTYLLNAPPPTAWDYPEVLKFASFLVGIGLAKLQHSPLPGKED